MAEKKRPSTNARTKAQARSRPPPLPADALVQRGEYALSLVEQYSAVKERLPAGTVPNLRSDLDAFSGRRENVTLAAIDSRQATAAQNDALRTLFLKVSSVRNAVNKSTSTASVRKGYGLHVDLKSDVVTSVTAASKAIIKRATAEKTKEEARAFGILDSDVAELQALTARLEEADDEQETLRAKKPLSTRERNETGMRIWAAIKSISAKGILAYALDQNVRAQFDALDDLPVKKRARG